MTAVAARAALIGAMLVVGGCMPQVDRADRDRTFVLARFANPGSADPATLLTGVEALVIEATYQQLTLIVATPAGPRIVGDLAQSWQVAPDGCSIAIRLKAGQHFADGSLVDAEAVKFSFDRAKRIGRGGAAFLQWLDGVDILDRLDLRLRLSRPYAPALAMLSHQASSIVNPRIVRAHDVGDEALGWMAEHSAGSGSYYIADNRPGERLLLRANAKIADRPSYFQQVELRVAPDEGVRRLLLERGDIDAVEANLVPASLVARYRAISGVKVTMRAGGPMWSFLLMNNASGPLRDVRVRKAVALAVDYAALRDKILKRNAIQISGFLPPGTPGFDSHSAPPRRDLGAARHLLRAAGYTQGLRLTMLIGQLGPTAEFLQSNLRDVGIELLLERRSYAAVAALKDAGRFDLLYDSWSMDTPDAAVMLQALLGGRNARPGGTNTARYRSAEADALLDALVAEPRADRRAPLFARLDARLRADQPIAFLFSANPVVAYRADITGMALDPYSPQLLPFAQLRRRFASAPR